MSLQGLNQAADVDFDQTWQVLESAFHEIHTKNASKLSFETLYRNAYKLVLKKQGEQLYQKVADFEKQWLSSEVKKKVVYTLSQDLLDLKSGSATSTPQRRESEERFLKELRQVWQDHQISMSMLTDVMMYMDRVYCADTRRPSIFAKAMSLFRDHILYAELLTSVGDQKTLLQVLTDIVLDQVRMDREGDVTDKSLVRANIYMLEGLFETEVEAEDEKLYLKKFESQFLDDSIRFYQDLGEAMLTENDASRYCQKTWDCISKEQDRCRSMLSELTTEKITKVVDDYLIRNNIQSVIEMDSGVSFMIENDRLTDLKNVFGLEARVDVKKSHFTKKIRKIISDSGAMVNNAALMATASPTAGQASTEDGEDKAPKPGQDRALNVQTVAALKWVEDILALKDKFDRIHRDSLGSDQVLQTVMTRSIGDVINSFSRCSEYISLFIDENMKKGIKGKTEQEVEEVLEKAITLLRYVQDKDLFENYYKKHLCRRLIMGKSLSIEAEKSMISRMKIELGNAFTSKLEAMFKDMNLSEELTAGYKNHISGLGDSDTRRIELAIHVLTSMTWPLDTMRGLDDERDARLKTIYPGSIEKLKSSFEQYYAGRYSGRVLSWQGNMGTADMKATFPKVPSKEGPRPRTHDINVSTYAMIILLLFNDVPAKQSLSFEDIQGKTNIPTNELVRNLQSLAVAPKTRILIKEPMSKDVKATDRFSFNEGFQSKFIKIKVGVVSASNRVESDRERKETEKKNNDSRGFVIEAAVVRIMKQRKELPHAQLITETLSQLNSQFKPDVTMIKKKIESLIEREYLERVEEPPLSKYRYLA
ncbi:Cullin-3 [Sphaceloma murrayae]|uniref:Cullin-3 n=1 Tax=Sphaceloma murrayae TaxID=2082308 RepID=A0A2K1R2X6_9PEZI|nr:Cullin-3 [Sphaceloma murrayae]